MKSLWTYIDEKKWSAYTKYQAVILILGVLSALTGLAAWLLIRDFALSTPDWMFCFIGYPIVFSWFAIFFYSIHHDFHDGPTG